jgi:hypothetical protein
MYENKERWKKEGSFLYHPNPPFILKTETLFFFEHYTFFIVCLNGMRYHSWFLSPRLGLPWGLRGNAWILAVTFVTGHLSVTSDRLEPRQDSFGNVLRGFLVYR